MVTKFASEEDIKELERKASVASYLANSKNKHTPQTQDKSLEGERKTE